MDEPYRLRVKLGDNEFDGAGDKASVDSKFEEFKSLVQLLAGSKPPVPPPTPDDPDKRERNGNNPPATLEATDLLLILEHDEKKGIISLRKRPMGEDANSESFLLILLGYKTLANREEVVVTDLKDALEKSGVTFKRVDRLADPCMRQRWVLKGGKGKGGKYSLTNTGIERAQQALGTMLAHVK